MSIAVIAQRSGLPPCIMVSKHMGAVRSLVEADLPALARLFQKVFYSRESTPSSALEAYLGGLYLPPINGDGGIESKVYVADSGAIVGFCGVNELPMTINGRPIRAAAFSSLMVDSAQADATAAGRLMRTLRQGAQDFSFSETASATSVAMWKGLRGSVLPLHSLDWLRIFDPLQFTLDLARQRVPTLGVLAPVLAPFDRLIRKGGVAPESWRLRPIQARTWFEERELDTAGTAELVQRFAADYSLAPAWPPEALKRKIEDAASKSLLGPMTSRVVTGAEGRLIGFFIYHGRRGRVGRVLQLLALPNQTGAVLDCMFSHASTAGLVGLRGRSDPALLDAARERQLIFTSRAATVVDSRDPEIVEALQRGSVLLHGLAGEIWSRLHFDVLG